MDAVAFKPACGSPFWRCVGEIGEVCKRALKATAGHQRVTDGPLLTFVAEAESVMNNRLLTNVSSDCNDLEALRSNHCLLGRANPNIPLDSNHFWSRSLHEDLPSLTVRPK